jgi:hypothetical protein
LLHASSQSTNEAALEVLTFCSRAEALARRWFSNSMATEAWPGQDALTIEYAL